MVSHYLAAMSWPDFSNAVFEFVGGIAIMRTVFKAWSIKRVAGVHWWTPGFFWAWGAWNIYYYPHLDQWISFSAGLFIFAANTLWVYTLWRFGEK